MEDDFELDDEVQALFGRFGTGAPGPAMTPPLPDRRQEIVRREIEEARRDGEYPASLLEMSSFEPDDDTEIVELGDLFRRDSPSVRHWGRTMMIAAAAILVVGFVMVALRPPKPSQVAAKGPPQSETPAVRVEKGGDEVDPSVSQPTLRPTTSEGPATTATPTTSPTITLSQGDSGPVGFWYSVNLSGFDPGSSVTLSCNDSVDSTFYSQVFTINSNGEAYDATLCYSGDGPEHWVIGGGVESNRVTWIGLPAPSEIQCVFSNFRYERGVWTWSETWTWRVKPEVASYNVVLSINGTKTTSEADRGTFTTDPTNGEPDSGTSLVQILSVGPTGNAARSVTTCGAFGGTGWQPPLE